MAEATGILIMRAIRALSATLTPEVAEGLLTAIAMDTGWLRHSNTRPGTLRAVAELMEAGARIDEIYRKLFERNTLGRVRLMAQRSAPYGSSSAVESPSRQSAATIWCAPAPSRKTRRTSSTSWPAFAGSRWPCFSSSRGGEAQGLLPRAKRSGLFAVGRPVRRRRPSGSRRSVVARSPVRVRCQGAWRGARGT